MASGAADVDDPGKRKFLKKFGKRVGNVFSKKRNSQASIDNDFPFPPPQHSATGVIKNPLVGADIPSPDVYAPSQPQIIAVPAEPRSGGGRARSGFYADVGALTSAAHEELSPPERCLSEGDLVESSAVPRSERLGGRVWRAVPGSMDNLPKSLMGELSRKINTRGHSGSEDEGLPHSPPADHPLAVPAPAPGSRSHSSKSLTSCGDSSDGERSEELDFNALRRAESLDNTAAKHRIQVGRQRRKAAGPGALRKHKSCTTVQLAGITEEAPGKEELQVPLLRRQGSHDSAALLAQELEEMRGKEEEGEKEKRTERKEMEKGRTAPSTALPVLRPVRKALSSSLANPLPSTRHSAAPVVTLSTAPATGFKSSKAVASEVRSSTTASSAASSSAAPAPGAKTFTATAGATSSTTAASRIGRLRSMFSSEPSSEPPPRPASSASHRPASRIQSHPGESAAPAPSTGLVKAASLSGPAPKSFTVPTAAKSKPPGPPGSPPPSLMFSASVGAKVLSAAPTSPTGSKTLPLTASKAPTTTSGPTTAKASIPASVPTSVKVSPTASAPPKTLSSTTAAPGRAASNFSAARLSFKTGDLPKAAPSTGAAPKPLSSAHGAASHAAGFSSKPALPAATRKAPDSSTETETVTLREKKSPETAEEVASRPVSRVMDLVRNFQRLQESSTS